MRYKNKEITKATDFGASIDYIPVNIYSYADGKIGSETAGIVLSASEDGIYTSINEGVYFHKKRQEYDNPEYLLLDEAEKETTTIASKAVDEYWQDGRVRYGKKQQDIRYVEPGQEFQISDIGIPPILADEIVVDNQQVVTSAEYKTLELQGPPWHISGIFCKAGISGKTLIHIKNNKTRRNKSDGSYYVEAEETVTVPVIVQAAENQGE